MFDSWMEPHQFTPFCNQNCAASACQHNPISEIQHNLEDEILFSDTVVKVITLAHKYAMEYEQLGFFMQDPSTANPANFEADEGTQYEPSIGPDIEPVEAPVDKGDGEPLAEDRVVPHTADEETVVVDGMTMTLGCTRCVQVAVRWGCLQGVENQSVRREWLNMWWRRPYLLHMVLKCV